MLRTEGPLGVARHSWQFFVAQSFSSLTRRIVFLNVFGLLALVLSILQFSQLRAGLIEASVRSLVVQGEMIAGAIAGAATVEGDSSITVDPGRLLDLQTGETYGPGDDAAFEFSINPERVGPLLRRLVLPTNTRARIYGSDGALIIDSRNVGGRSDVLGSDLPSPPPPSTEKPGLIERTFIAIRTWLSRGELQRYYELGSDNGKGYPEVVQALSGQNASAVRIDERGRVIVSVALPVQRFRAVRGALLLSTQAGDIDQRVEAERRKVVKMFLIAAAIMVLLSVLLASTIAGPVRRLSEAAELVRRRTTGRVDIPDFTRRRDEIGHLSGALRDMTNALYSRIASIESFAADVAHELKNPLTSLRSAVETLPLARTDESRSRLLKVISHDVRRLDRLISDISDASRLDAEMQRQIATPLDLARLLKTVVGVANEVKQEDVIKVSLAFEGAGPTGFVVPGHDSRLGQVINNLIDNARSFSSPGGGVRVVCRRLKGEIEIVVDDDGPGINPAAMEKIFERFYTDRPHQGFGQNSGLGLSISLQIVEAHGGRLWAENRVAPAAGSEPPKVLGARFTVRLPAL
ncbi:MAG TPA: stimulus-sensing domain-containing protein [Xanthobacteraceae bacterium]|nr:stimulus-sensing domain-containing protein [Xanthobacteraceae bacterium]